MPTLFYPTCTCISAHPGLNTNIKRALEKPLKWSIAKLRHAGLCHLCRYTFFPCHARCLLEALIPWLPILLPKIPCFKDRCCSLSQSLINILFCLNYSKWSAKSVLLWKIAYRQLISNICECAECIQILNFCCSPLASLQRERFTPEGKFDRPGFVPFQVHFDALRSARDFIILPEKYEQPWR